MSYFIGNQPASFQDVATELRKIQEAMNNPQPFLMLDTLYAAPPKPREGQIVKADGVTWNPGRGAGFYGYRAGAWRFLG